MHPIRSITVYCSSSGAIPAPYFEAGKQLGAQLAARGIALVYGGNSVGLMGTVADAARAGGAKVIGITPKLFVEKGVHDQKCDDLVVCESMRERKHLLEQRGDAFVALPGGIGTFEELFEIIVGKQLHYHAKPIVLLNTLNYWTPLLALIDHGIEHRFIKPHARDLFHVANDVPSVFHHLDTYRAPEPTEKWFSQSSSQG